MSNRIALVIGDNPSLYISISYIFSLHGCQCKIALDGNIANDRLLALNPEFIILDLPLRSSPGTQSIKQIGETLQKSRTRILIMAPEALLHRSDLRFANVHLVKPFSEQQAETAIRRLINLSSVTDTPTASSDYRIGK